MTAERTIITPGNAGGWTLREMISVVRATILPELRNGIEHGPQELVHPVMMFATHPAKAVVAATSPEAHRNDGSGLLEELNRFRAVGILRTFVQPVTVRGPGVIRIGTSGGRRAVMTTLEDAQRPLWVCYAFLDERSGGSSAVGSWNELSGAIEVTRLGIN